MRTALLLLLAALAAGQPVPPVPERSLPPGMELLATLRGPQCGGPSIPPVIDSGGDLFVFATCFMVSGQSFPLAAKRFGPLGGWDVLVIKLSGRDGRMLGAMLIGGSNYDTLGIVAADASGGVLLAGFTASTDFPTTRGVLHPQKTGDWWVVRVNAAADDLVFSTYTTQRISALAADTSGVYVGGWLDVFPESAYLEKWNVAASQSQRSARISNLSTIATMAVSPRGDLLVYGMSREISEGGRLSALDANTLEARWSAPAGAPILGDAIVTTDASGNIYAGAGYSAGFKKFTPDGRVLFSKDVHDAPGSFAGVEPDGTAYTFGAAAPNSPTLHTFMQCGLDASLLSLFDPSGNRTLATYVPAQSTMARPASGRLYMTRFVDGAMTASVFDRAKAARPRLAPACLIGAANYSYTPLTPGGVATIVGSGVGPETPATFSVESGRVPTMLAGVEVHVGGRAAPILYAHDRQINFVTPWTTPLSPGETEVCISYRGERACLSATVATSAPQIFAVVNQDGTENRAGQAAPLRSVVTLYMTGVGRLNPTMEDGAIAQAPLPALSWSLQADLFPGLWPRCTLAACGGGPLPMQVLYAGAAPGMVSGVTQINLRVPEFAQPQPAPYIRLTLADGKVVVTRGLHLQSAGSAP